MRLQHPGDEPRDFLGNQRQARAPFIAPFRKFGFTAWQRRGETGPADGGLDQLCHQLALAADNRRLQNDSNRTERERLAAVNRRLAAETEENVRLRKALDEAQAKLDAIANIERQTTVRQPTAPEGRP